MKVEIDAKIEYGRIVQVFLYGETNSEHCVHGIKLRWHCDECEEYVEDLATQASGEDTSDPDREQT